ncbi:MAG: hypothetical protein WDN46_05030 [Methylocella sp.]
MTKPAIGNCIKLEPVGTEFVAAPDGQVAIRFFFAAEEFGLKEGLAIAIHVAPDEARRIARVLLEQADSAEINSSRKH